MHAKGDGQSQPDRGLGPRLEPLCWLVAAVGLYLLLGETAFYKTDGPDIVRLLDEHLQTGAPLAHPWHCGFLPALLGFRRLLAWCGLHPGYLQLGVWFSAVGVAVGVAGLRAGARLLGLPAPVARLATAALMLSPGSLLFGTVVEFHGPLLGMVGICFWWTCGLVARPAAMRAVGLGGLCHLAFLIDGQALFLPGWLAAFWLARRAPQARWARELALVGLFLLVHGLLFVVLPRLLPAQYGFWADLAAGLREEGSIGRPQSLDYAPHIFWHEWLAPLLPLSLLVFTAPLQRALRAEFAAFAVGAAPFFYLSVRQLVFEPEHGAYLLPMVLPAALLVAQAAGPRLQRRLWPLLLVGLLPWLAEARPPLREAAVQDAAFAAAVAQAAAAKKPLVLVGSARELSSAYARLAPDELLWVRSSAAMPLELATPAHFAGMVAQLRALHQQGRAVLLTNSALASLEDPAAAMLQEKASLKVPDNATLAGPRFASALREHFDLQPLAGGLLRVVPR